MAWNKNGGPLDLMMSLAQKTMQGSAIECHAAMTFRGTLKKEVPFKNKILIV
jgi:hypothetical protein